VLLDPRARDERSCGIAGALLVAASLFVKHNLAALPLAALLALPRSRRRRAWAAATLLLVVPLGHLACRGIYGPDFMRYASSVYPFDLAVLPSSAIRWGLKLLPLLALTASLAVRGVRDGARRFVLVFATLGVGEGIVGACADVDSNAMFEGIEALALGAALAVEAWPRAVNWVVLAALVPFGYGALRHARVEWWTRAYWLSPRAEAARDLEAEIAFLRGRPCPAICNEPLLCHWAGKALEVDVNLAPTLDWSTRTIHEAEAGLDARGIRTIELAPNPISLLAHFTGTRGFVFDHAGPNGSFFVAKEGR
jgi:hypothetical protein